MMASAVIRFSSRTSRRTGFPAPARQVSAQVRSSTGATFGADAHRLPPGWRCGDVWQAEPSASTARKRGAR